MYYFDGANTCEDSVNTCHVYLRAEFEGKVDGVDTCHDFAENLKMVSHLFYLKSLGHLSNGTIKHLGTT